MPEVKYYAFATMSYCLYSDDCKSFYNESLILTFEQVKLLGMRVVKQITYPSGQFRTFNETVNYA